MSLSNDIGMDVALTAGAKELLLYAPHTDEGYVDLEKVTLVPGLDLAKHATDYMTFEIIDKEADGAGTGVIGTLNTSTASGVALSANVPVDIPLTSSPTNLATAITLKKTDAAGTPTIGNSKVLARIRKK
jgi:hypothetical protein